MKVGIIGGGPAGLSLARLLSGRSGIEVTVFEAAGKPGGKSQSARLRETIVEFGTATITMSPRALRGWMRREGIDLVPLSGQRFDRAEFGAYLKAGAGASLKHQMLRYLFERRRLMSALRAPSKPGWAVEEAAQPIRAWLERHDLPKVERYMHRYLTALGHGFLDELPSVQALRGVDPDRLLTSLLQQESRPLQGWGTFWLRLSRDMDLRLNCRITGISRSEAGCTIFLDTGVGYAFDQIVCAIPLDEFAQMTDPSPDEAKVAGAVRWGSYATSLVTARNWFSDHQLEAFSGGIARGSPPGSLLHARREGPDNRTGGQFYMAAQVPGGLELADVKEALQTDIELRGGRGVQVIESRVFRHAPRYSPDAIRSGLLTRMEQMQGTNRTWYTGATFSHDSVPHIVGFNKWLAAAIARRP